MSADTSPIGRFYYLPLTLTCLEGCRLCDLLPCTDTSARDLASVERVIKKARRGEFRAMIFPSGILTHSQAIDIVQLCEAHGLEVIIQIDSGLLTTEVLNRLTDLKRDIGFNVVLTEISPIFLEPLQELQDRGVSLHFTFVPLRSRATLEWLAALPGGVLKNLHFHLLPFTAESSQKLTLTEGHGLLQRIRKKFPQLKIRPPLGQEVWDPRIAPELGLEPDVQPSFQYRISGGIPRISVVIPSYNSAGVLRNTLRHILRQNLDRSQYEVIVVDDGSDDNTEEQIRNFVAPEATDLNFTFLRHARRSQRKMGDGNFRAGVSRNLGVKYAQGEFLCFLDADIIISSDHLEDLLTKHQQWDVIQCVRLHLKDDRRNELVRFESIDSARDAFVLEKNYWGTFFAQKNWESLPLFWKYTCTYALSLRTQHFKEAGWFRRTFVYYGFEDTDLGYRLAQQGRRFYLNPRITYHLSQGRERSEYRSSSFERHRLLSKTAKIFYLNNLDPQIYEHFRAWMGDEGSPSLLLRRFRLKEESP